jgi:polysaccharide pyruvyl transferase WcaK-like protein
MNLGDDILMVACGSILKNILPSATVGALCRDNSYLHRLAPGLTPLPMGGPLSRCSLMVLGGGTQFYSFPNTQQGGKIPWLRRKLRFAPLLRGVLTRGRKLVWSGGELASRMAALGVGTGPFVLGSREEHGARGLLELMDFIAVRDQASLSICQDWGLARVMLGADLAFLPELWLTACRRAAVLPEVGTKGRVAIVVRDWPHTNEGASYGAPLLEVVTTMRAKGLEATFILFCERSDQRWARTLESRGERYISWDPEACSISDFVFQLSEYDALITTRYHGAVIAALAGRPAICVGLEPKLELVADLVSNRVLLWRYPFRAAECLALVDRLYASYPEFAKLATAAAAEQKQVASRMVDAFRMAITSAGLTQRAN